MAKDEDLTRRDFGVRLLGGLTAAAALAACGEAATGGTGVVDAGGADGTASGQPDAGGGADAGGGTTCTVYPQETEGPFYLDLNSLRRDVTEGKGGTPLRLTVLVQSAACMPLKDLAVDIWQCDADGVYSGFPGQLGGLDTTGQTFLRGTQVTDEAGTAIFETIYPGWYPGRTTHIHFKVHVTSTREATSQLYFPEETTSDVYANQQPYAARGQKDTSNARDATAQAGGFPPLLLVTGDATGYTATLTVTVAS